MATTSDAERELLQSDSEQHVSELSSKDTSQTMLSDIAQLFEAKLEQKFSSFKRSIEDKDAYHASEIKKIKSEAKAASSFKFKGNRVQFEFNNQISDGVDKCLVALTQSNLAEVETDLKSLKEKVAKRNKLIRFADKALPDGLRSMSTNPMSWRKIRRMRRSFALLSDGRYRS